MRTLEFERSRVERRQSAVAEIQIHLTRLFRGFVGWASLYEDVEDNDEQERRERVVQLLDELSKRYLPRSVWLMEGNRKKVETYLTRAEELCPEFSAEIEARGYHRVRRSMEKRVSKKLRPLKTEAEYGLESELSEPRRVSALQHFSVFSSSLALPRVGHRCLRRSGTTSCGADRLKC